MRKRNENMLLALLPQTELLHWQGSLELKELAAGMVLHEPGEQLPFVYFPTTALVTLHYDLQNAESAHFAMVGREGVVGSSLLMGSDIALSRAVVRIAGHAYRLPADVMKSSFEGSSALMQVMLSYTHALMAQMSRIAVCNQHHFLDQRLCLWLLLSFDRIPDNELKLTQQQIAATLGVRRSGVAIAAHELQQRGLVSYKRGMISVLDRTGLERRACECYRAVKTDYDRLLLLHR